MPDLLEVTFDLQVGALPADHRYELYAAIKDRVGDVMADRDWQLRAIQGGRRRGDRILYDRDDDPTLQLRLPKDDIGYIGGLEGAALRVGPDVVELQSSRVAPIEPYHTLQSDLVTIRSNERAPHGYWAGDMGAAIGKALSAQFGRRDFAIHLGERRSFRVSGQRQYGHPVRLKALDDDESRWLQRHGLGRSLSMGCGSFWPVDAPLNFEEVPR